MTAPRLHLLVPNATAEQRASKLALCGWFGGANARLTESPAELVSKDACRWCRKRWAKLAAEQLLEGLPPGTRVGVDLGVGESFTPVPWTPPPPLFPAPVGARELEPVSVDALERARLGAGAPARRWKSVGEALLTLFAHLDDGASVPSTSHPGRFTRVQHRNDPAAASTAQLDRLHGVAMAFAGAYRQPRELYVQRVVAAAGVGIDGAADRVGAGLKLERVVVSVEAQRAILVWSLAGRAITVGKRRERIERRSLSPAEVADEARARFGLELTEHQVGLIAHAGARAVRERLRASGELEGGGELGGGGEAAGREGVHVAPMEVRRETEETTMAVLGYDLAGWGEISAVVGLSERKCRELAQRPTDPLPVHRIEDVRGVHARRDDLKRWLEKNARRVGVA